MENSCFDDRTIIKYYPLFCRMYGRAFKHCLCGDRAASDVLSSFFRLGNKRNNYDWGLFWHILFWFIIGIAGLAILIGLAYLYFAVTTNGVARLFDDTICENSVWQTCKSQIFYQDGHRRSTVSGVMPAFFMHFFFVIPLITGIVLLFCRFEDREDKKWKISWVSAISSLFIAWVYLWFIITLFLSKPLATNYIDGCSDYKNYSNVLWDLMESPGIFVMCKKIRSNGFNKGAIDDPSLPGNRDACRSCMNRAFWPFFLAISAIPLIAFVVVLFSRCYQKSLAHIKEENNGETDSLLVPESVN